MPDSYNKVAEFNKTFNNPVRTKPGLHHDDIPMRLGLVLEEVLETRDAYANFKFLEIIENTLIELDVDREKVSLIMHHLQAHVEVEFLDGLADTRVVNEGLAQGTGMPINEAFEAVHASNMSKAQPDGTVLRREDGKVQKGENYFAPTLELHRILGYS